MSTVLGKYQNLTMQLQMSHSAPSTVLPLGESLGVAFAWLIMGRHDVIHTKRA